MKPVEERAKEALAYLASKTPDQIAAELAARGIKGRICHIEDCLLARYLRNAIGTRVMVGGSYMDVLTEDENGEPRYVEMDLPPSVYEFRRYFDAGKYPWLVDHSTSHGA